MLMSLHAIRRLQPFVDNLKLNHNNRGIKMDEQLSDDWICQQLEAERSKMMAMQLPELLTRVAMIYRINPTGLPGEGNVRERTIAYVLSQLRETLSQS
jgi:hypothetical protein